MYQVKKYLSLFLFASSCVSFFGNLNPLFADLSLQINDQCPPLTTADLSIDPKVDRFYFLRHGVTDWNKDMLALGPQDLSLNDEGKQQVLNSLKKFDDITINEIYTSSTKRCLESALIVAEYIGSNEVIVSDKLDERHFGNWAQNQEKIRELIEQAEEGPSFFMQVKHIIETLLPTDAESHFEFEIRVVDYINKISQFIPEDSLIVSHGCYRDALIKYLNVSKNNAGYKEHGRPLKFEKQNDGSWTINPV